ncbi:hypothetical protein EVAR_49632_1 [Eumeta japonica]|uniref:Uncharacterized protein n=1 Tax=Eumeta variegata TaxID=151549 RepID=A0A4C1Y828_EUMVA|nr:hypothetical protein EVAR_49632_1 [Eumeta japonica]
MEVAHAVMVLNEKTRVRNILHHYPVSCRDSGADHDSQAEPPLTYRLTVQRTKLCRSELPANEALPDPSYFPALLFCAIATLS